MAEVATEAADFNPLLHPLHRDVPTWKDCLKTFLHFSDADIQKLLEQKTPTRLEARFTNQLKFEGDGAGVEAQAVLLEVQAYMQSLFPPGEQPVSENTPLDKNWMFAGAEQLKKIARMAAARDLYSVPVSELLEELKQALFESKREMLAAHGVNLNFEAHVPEVDSVTGRRLPATQCTTHKFKALVTRTCKANEPMLHCLNKQALLSVAQLYSAEGHTKRYLALLQGDFDEQVPLILF